MDEDTAPGETVSRSLTRRRLLAATGVGLAGVVAGCNDAADETTPAADAETATATADPSPASTAAPTVAETGDATATAEETTPTATESVAERDELAREESWTMAPPDAEGANAGYDDGFADPAPWLTDETPVYAVTEPTRDALVEAVDRSGPRVVVFETSGTIDLDGEWLSIRNDELWLAGQTAPSPGIAIVRGRVSVEADDCVIQHLRFRAGDEGGGNPDGLDALHTGDGTSNNVVDHCSASWSTDETLSVGYRTTDTTVTNCLVSHPLDDSLHTKGPHGYGSLTGDDSKGVTYAGNVWAHAVRRNPRLKSGSEGVVVNNVMYNFQTGTAMDWDNIYTIEGNHYLPGRQANEPIHGGAQNGDEPDAYVEDNVVEPDGEMTNGFVTQLDERPHWPDGLEAIPAENVMEHNLRFAGARPADRTDYDRRVIEDVRTRSGDRIDSQSEVGGYPDLAENERELAVPAAGLRNWLERWALAVETDDADPPAR